jgi:hypothetical protein
MADGRGMRRPIWRAANDLSAAAPGIGGLRVGTTGGSRRADLEVKASGADELSIRTGRNAQHGASAEPAASWPTNPLTTDVSQDLLGAERLSFATSMVFRPHTTQRMATPLKVEQLQRPPTLRTISRRFLRKCKDKSLRSRERSDSGPVASPFGAACSAMSGKQGGRDADRMPGQAARTIWMALLQAPRTRGGNRGANPRPGVEAAPSRTGPECYHTGATQIGSANSI